jgi:hypothetical protein
MVECPYCGAESVDDARFCDRCGERLSRSSDDRDGFLRETSIQYLQGVRHGARPLDPESTYHDELQTDLEGAIEDFSYLAGIDALNLSTAVDVDGTAFRSLGTEISPDTDIPDDERRSLGIAVLVGLLDDAYDGRTLDELRALSARDRG